MNKLQFEKFYKNININSIPYPFYNKHKDFEGHFIDYYFNNSLEVEREFIPVRWTEIYNCNTQLLSALQEAIKELDKTKKYFTVSTHDDAPREDFGNLDVIHFVAGGNFKHSFIPIPLIGEQIPTYPDKSKTIFASFVGSATHPIRNKMAEAVRNNRKYAITMKTWEHNISHNNQNHFLDVMSRSVFSLCPRGYGATSFRLYEALQLKSIPVYISDRFLLPFLDRNEWEKFSVLIEENQIKDMDRILSGFSESDIQNMIRCGQEVYQNYFTVESSIKNIIKYVRN